jgi:hypothetical protein
MYKFFMHCQSSICNLNKKNQKFKALPKLAKNYLVVPQKPFLEILLIIPLFALPRQHLQLDQKVEQTCAALAVKSRLCPN